MGGDEEAPSVETAVASGFVVWHVELGMASKKWLDLELFQKKSNMIKVVSKFNLREKAKKR